MPPTRRAAFFAQLRLYKLKLSSAKSRFGAAQVDFPGYDISSDSPIGHKVAALTRISMPSGIKQFRSLVGGLSYYCKCLRNFARRLHPAMDFLRKDAIFVFTPDMERIVRELSTELAALPTLFFSNRDAVIENSRRFLLHCDANTDGLGATAPLYTSAVPRWTTKNLNSYGA